MFYFSLCVQANSALKAITGCYLTYSFKTLNMPERVKTLIPENVIVGAYDKISGIIDTESGMKLK